MTGWHSVGWLDPKSAGYAPGGPLHHTAISHPRQAGKQAMTDPLDAYTRILQRAQTMFIAPAQSDGFSGFDLAVGEVYGLRSWRIDKYGRLSALHISNAPLWRPGINVAVCNKSTPHTYTVTIHDDGLQEHNVIDPTGQGRKAVEVKYDRQRQVAGRGDYFSWDVTSETTAYTVTWDDGEVMRYEHGELQFEPHAAPDESCKCGFYAYNDPETSELMDPDDNFVLGVIRGTGNTLIGSKGFRTEKAEIVALLDPTRGGRKSATWRTKQRDLLARVYPDVPLIDSRKALVAFAPIVPEVPDPSTEEFWSL